MYERRVEHVIQKWQFVKNLTYNFLQLKIETVKGTINLFYYILFVNWHNNSLCDLSHT